MITNGKFAGYTIKTLKVSPCLPCPDLFYSRKAYIEQSRDAVTRVLCIVKPSHCKGLTFSEHTTRSFSECFILSAFPKHIVRIIFCSPRKKMGRITAEPIVAFMKNTLPIWYFAVVQFPRKAMGFNGNAVNYNKPIPGSVFAPVIFPARIWKAIRRKKGFIYSTPKSAFRRAVVPIFTRGYEVSLAITAFSDMSHFMFLLKDRLQRLFNYSKQKNKIDFQLGGYCV